MNTRTPRFASSAATRTSLRAALSPLLRRSTQATLTRSRAALAAVRAQRDLDLAADTLTPATPTLGSVRRWWDPHLVDRLQAPLTRYHE